ncbi:hypothetical protein [Enterococcus phage ECP3]|uniref:Uncharacterized protein n=1 Tax=Enterococcus phage ECP3 TaxID=1498168 RepID=A0A096XTD8_9CAUD|nr:hypothetical protein [Enterococcus phage ECP3]AII28565.1 hypothetical protein [Enterococcus phage ECP3]
MQYERIRKLEKRKRGEPPEFIFNGNYSLEEIELFLHFRKEGKNMLKTEEINNSECTGYLILDGDNLIVRVEKIEKQKKFTAIFMQIATMMILRQSLKLINQNY